jgi:hypothetical protein
MSPSSTLDEATRAYTSSTTKNGEHNSNGSSTSKVVSKATRKWHFDTLQVHSGLENETAHGQCSLPIYNSASFRFKSSKSIEDAYSFSDGPRSQFYMYSRLSNVSTS